MTLAELKSGSHGVVREIGGGYGIRRRLTGLGLHPGDRVEVIRAPLFHGPALVRVHDVQIAIGWRMAKNVQLDAVNEP